MDNDQITMTWTKKSPLTYSEGYLYSKCNITTHKKLDKSAIYFQIYLKKVLPTLIIYSCLLQNDTGKDSSFSIIKL